MLSNTPVSPTLDMVRRLAGIVAPMRPMVAQLQLAMLGASPEDMPTCMSLLRNEGKLILP